MSTVIHEGKKYEAKDIPGHGLSFVPVKEITIYEELRALNLPLSQAASLNLTYEFYVTGYTFKVIQTIFANKEQVALLFENSDCANITLYYFGWCDSWNEFINRLRDRAIQVKKR